MYHCLENTEFYSQTLLPKIWVSKTFINLLKITHRGDFRILLPLRFYVKSILVILPFWSYLLSYFRTHFDKNVTFTNFFSNKFESKFYFTDLSILMRTFYAYKESTLGWRGLYTEGKFVYFRNGFKSLHIKSEWYEVQFFFIHCKLHSVESTEIHSHAIYGILKTMIDFHVTFAVNKMKAISKLPQFTHCGLYLLWFLVKPI